LANGLGNLVSRVAKLCEREDLGGFAKSNEWYLGTEDAFKNYSFNQVLSNIWSNISITDGIISDEKPWKIQNKKELRENLVDMSQAFL